MRNLGGHRLLILAAVVLAVCPGSVAAPAVPEGLGKLETIVVLYLENRSFDHLYGHFPGANGPANAGAVATQTDESGKPYETLPAPLDLRWKPPVPYMAITEKLPNGPFPLHKYLSFPKTRNHHLACFSRSASICPIPTIPTLARGSRIMTRCVSAIGSHTHPYRRGTA